MENEKQDFTTYPEGFNLMIEKLNIPSLNDDLEKKTSFFIGFMDSLIKQ